jgi:hypothetical protein
MVPKVSEKFVGSLFKFSCLNAKAARSSEASALSQYFARLMTENLTLLWYHEKSYVNSTMGSI